MSWQTPELEEYNRKQRLSNYPPDQRWAKVDGIGVQGLKDGRTLLAIQGHDHKGEWTTFWTDLPNAMYLLNLLSYVQKETRAPVPSESPPEAAPYDGGQ